MSIYINRLHGYFVRGGKYLGGVEVVLFSQTANAVIFTTHTNQGYWTFVNLDPGFYNIEFHGRGTTQEDWLFGLEVVDSVTAGDSDPPINSSVTAALET